MYRPEQGAMSRGTDGSRPVVVEPRHGGAWGLDAVRGGFHELQERYHRLVELAPDGILVHDGEYIVMANRAALRLAGAEQAESLVGRPVEEFLELPLLKYLEGDAVTRAFAQAAEAPGGAGHPVRDVLRRVDGSPLDVEVTAIPFLSDGRVAAHLIVRDLTERVQQERATRRAASTITLLLEQLPATLWTTDAELRVTSTQYGRRDRLGERFHAFGGAPADGAEVPADEITPLRSQQRALQGQPTTYDVVREGKAFEVHVAPLYAANGAVTGIVGLALDVTERRQREAAAREAQEAAVVGTLAGGVAHEVNNMMTVVLAFADLLSEDLAGQVEPLAEVAQIRHAAHRAADITRQLLAFSRRTAHVPEVVVFDDAVAGLLPVVRQLLGESRSAVVHLGCRGGVELDRGQLEQVVVNLVLNARDAMAAGSLTLSTTTTVLAEPVAGRTNGVIPRGAYAQLTVRDTGAGIDAHTAAHLFEPFFTTKPVGEGTGLGLAAVAGLMQQNHGHILVESVPGAWTTFTLLFPLLPDWTEPSEAPPVERASVPAHAGQTILVVDDEPAIRQVVTRGLTMLGYRVLPAADGAGALASLDREGSVDLILTDLMMPGMSGMELAALVKTRWPAVPIVFMSGYSEDVLRHEGAVDPAVHVIAKPFTVDEVARQIAVALVAHVPN